MRNLRGHLAEQNLLQRYKVSEVFAERCRMITSLAFLPPEDINIGAAEIQVNPRSVFLYYFICFKLLIDEDEPELQPVLDWFTTYYLGTLRNDGTRRVARY